MRNTHFIAAILSLATVVGTASADSLTYKGLDLKNADTATIRVDGGKSETVYAGKLEFQDGKNTIITVCADATSALNSSAHDYSVGTTNAFGKSGIDAAGRIVGTYFNSATTADQQAGLQLAVWSALYNGGSTFDASGKGFSVTGVSSDVLKDASYYYLAADLSAKTAIYYSTPANCGGQSQLSVVPAPEPACMAAIVMGALGVAKRRRAAKA